MGCEGLAGCVACANGKGVKQTSKVIPKPIPKSMKINAESMLEKVMHKTQKELQMNPKREPQSIKYQ